jgi:hypothetical protein
MVDNQAIVIPETIDAIRALTGREKTATASMAKTNAALGVPFRLSGRDVASAGVPSTAAAHAAAAMRVPFK